MLKIRLARSGAKKRPYYRIVIADARAPRDGRFIEKVGTYNPMLPKTDENRIRLNEDRIKYWLGHGAQPTDRVAMFLGNIGIIEKPVFNNPEKAKPSAKTQERLKEREEKLKAAEEAANAPAEEAAADAPAEDTAAEEAPAEEAAAEAPAEEAAAEEAPAEDTKAEEAPAEDAAAEEKAEDKKADA